MMYRSPDGPPFGPGSPTIRPGSPHALEPDARPVIHPGGNLDGDPFGPKGLATTATRGARLPADLAAPLAAGTGLRRPHETPARPPPAAAAFGGGMQESSRPT